MARGTSAQGLWPRGTALTRTKELVGHSGTDGVQTAAVVVEGAGGARIAASDPRLLKRVAGG